MKNEPLTSSSLLPDIYAHRGSTILAPENTSPAFDLALGFGADVLEIDVRLSRDNHVLVIHDARVDRTCNGRGAVCDMTLKELRQLDAGHHFTDMQGRQNQYRGARLMTLEELLEQYPGVRVNVDIKDNTARAAKAVADTIERTEAHTRINVGSFHKQALHHFRRMAPQVTTAASRAEVARLYFTPSRAAADTAYQYLQIPVSYAGIPLATQRFINKARTCNIRLIYWTINETRDMRLLFERGAHGIVTDRPDLACQLLGKCA